MVLKQTCPSQRAGFTLIEFIIVVVLIALLAVIMLGAINPGLMTERGRDAQRKKDLGRIRIAFEEYFNDKGCFPTQAMIDGLECEKAGFKPWLSNWPCDPKGTKYFTITDATSCPKSYKVLTNLSNKQDKQILSGWYSRNPSAKYGDGTLTINDINYGISSQNTNWSIESVPAFCITSFLQCYTSPGVGNCQALAQNTQYTNAYLDANCTPACMVSCCLNGNICVSP